MIFSSEGNKLFYCVNMWLGESSHDISWVLIKRTSYFYICCNTVCFFLFAVQLEVEMELVVENYVFTEDLKNESSPVYQETKKNFTTEVKHSCGDSLLTG